MFLALCAFSYYTVSSVRVPVSSGIIESRAATAVPTRPATAIPTPTATPAGPEEQIGILISKAMVAGGGQEVLSLDAFPLKDTGRYYVEVFVTVRDTLERDFAAKNLAFLIHHALWTSGLPIGAVQVWVHPSSVTTAGAGLILVNARAGWPLMHTQPWDGVGPAVWADFLRKNRTVGATEEDAVWFHGTGGNAP